MDLLASTTVLFGGLSLYLGWRNYAQNHDLEELRKTHGFALKSSESRFDNLRTDLDHATLNYDALLERCGVGVLILDEKGFIEKSNQTISRLMGASSHTLLGKTLLQMTLSDEIDDLFELAVTNHSAVEKELQSPGVSGLTLFVTITPLSITENTKYLLICHDVSELRRLENVRRDFVANVSHELRTPLTSIRAMAETLQGGALEDQQVAHRFLKIIVTETERLTRIAEDLLVLSDAESHEPEKINFSLTEMLQVIIGRFSTQAEKAEIEIVLKTPPDLRCFANADQMEQVLVNLVDNAIKYTQSGGRIEVASEDLAEYTAVHITDSGIGILRQDLSRIFERFYRVDKARSRQSGGTGLGLSIVKHIVESHGGVVKVSSEYNHGSTFTVLFPHQSQIHELEQQVAS